MEPQKLQYPATWLPFSNPRSCRSLKGGLRFVLGRVHPDYFGLFAAFDAANVNDHKPFFRVTHRGSAFLVSGVGPPTIGPSSIVVPIGGRCAGRSSATQPHPAACSAALDGRQLQPGPDRCRCTCRASYRAAVHHAGELGTYPGSARQTGERSRGHFAVQERNRNYATIGQRLGMLRTELAVLAMTTPSTTLPEEPSRRDFHDAPSRILRGAALVSRPLAISPRHCFPLVHTQTVVGSTSSTRSIETKPSQRPSISS